MSGVRSRRHTGSLWATPSGSRWATVDSALERADAAEPQFAGEAILECAPEPFDASLRLRRVGPDEANAKGLQHAAEVRGGPGARELFGQRPVGFIAGEHV